MKTILPLFICLAMLASGCDKIYEALGMKEEAAPPPKTSEEVWKGIVSEVQPGMERAEVESVLPPYQLGPRKRSLKDGGQIITYWLDNNWKVVLEYDFSGVPEGAAGKTVFDSPKNKLTKPPILTRQTL